MAKYTCDRHPASDASTTGAFPSFGNCSNRCTARLTPGRRIWHRTAKKQFIEAQGFTQSEFDPCYFFK
eukprot:2536174-Pleurochrysis_carterae.AAC.1